MRPCMIILKNHSAVVRACERPSKQVKVCMYRCPGQWHLKFSLLRTNWQDSEPGLVRQSSDLVTIELMYSEALAALPCSVRAGPCVLELADGVNVACFVTRSTFVESKY